MNFYRSAALALDHLDKHQGSVKGSLAAAKIQATPQENKRTLALIIETLKYRTALQQLLEKVPLTKLEKETFRLKGSPSSANLILVLLHDLLFSPKGKIEASDKWPPKQAIQRHQARLRAELVRLQLKAGKSSVRELGKVASSAAEARYVRWNPNVDLCRAGDWSLEALHTHLSTDLGMALITTPVYPVPEGKYFMDPHLPDELLVFPPNSSWWVGDKWYETGAVVLQDKASCFPAAIIMDGWGENGEDDQEGAECIDATAAPGNKTSFMSALMHNRGTLYAFERSPNRYKTLCNMLERAQCTNVQATRGDFTEANPADYPNVTRILLDPSCSGSGIVNRLDYLVEGDEEQESDDAQAERLEKLAGFQLQMIQHAFKFPAVKRIVYSTCSIHAEEDERVVAKALAAGRGEWRLAPRSSVIPSWPRRGRPEEMEGEDAESVIRCLPEDKTNGFFVSCFVRVDPNDVEETKPAAKGKGAKAKASGQKGKGNKEATAKETKDNEPKARAKADKPKESTGEEPKKGKKRPLEEDDEAEAEEVAGVTEEAVTEDATPKAKTAAQVERAKRKKQQQKKRRKTAVTA